MNKKLTLLLACCCVSGFFTACENETKDWKFTPNECAIEGVEVCHTDGDTTMVMVCKNGVFVESAVCGEDTPYCDDATHTCTATPTVCADGAFQCSGNVVQECKDNAWSISKSCEEAQVCNATTGACDPAPVTCTPGCSDDNKLTLCNEDGTAQAPVDCTASNQVCGQTADGTYACIEATESPCTVNDTRCSEDEKSVEICTADEEGATSWKTQTNCADDQKVCKKDGESAACIDSEPENCEVGSLRCNDNTIEECVAVAGNDGDAPDGNVAHNAWLTKTTCDTGMQCFTPDAATDTPADPVCAVPCTTESSACSEDGASLNVCNGEYIETHVCNASEGNIAYCANAACQEIDNTATAFFGAPCDCTGEDCNTTLTGQNLKDLFSEAGTAWYNTLTTKVENSDNIVGPNFFSANSTCSDLAAKFNIQAPAGMQIGCFRTSKVEFPASFVTLLTADFGKRITSAMDGTDKADAITAINEALTKVSSLLTDGIKFTANNGYCTMGALKIDGTLPKNVTDTPVDIFKTDAFSATATNSFVKPFNGGYNEDLGACPDGSSLYRYKISKSFSGLGGATIEYALCLKNCATDADCRGKDGYKCTQLTENSYIGDKANRPKVCFDEANHAYMEETLKPAINGFMFSLLR